MGVADSVSSHYDRSCSAADRGSIGPLKHVTIKGTFFI